MTTKPNCGTGPFSIRKSDKSWDEGWVVTANDPTTWITPTLPEAVALALATRLNSELTNTVELALCGIPSKFKGKE